MAHLYPKPCVIPQTETEITCLHLLAFVHKGKWSIYTLLRWSSSGCDGLLDSPTFSVKCLLKKCFASEGISYLCDWQLTHIHRLSNVSSQTSWGEQTPVPKWQPSKDGTKHPGVQIVVLSDEATVEGRWQPKIRGQTSPACPFLASRTPCSILYCPPLHILNGGILSQNIMLKFMTGHSRSLIQTCNLKTRQEVTFKLLFLSRNSFFVVIPPTDMFLYHKLRQLY